uniref:Uncharacterized protein n=1 Tax=Prolemur simus TaxID=1328070 RepID=A0A8C8YJX5_PROSS
SHEGPIKFLGVSFVRNRFQTLQGAPVPPSKDNTARRWTMGPTVLWAPWSGHSHLDLFLGDGYIR